MMEKTRRRFRVLRSVLKKTKTNEIILSFTMLFFIEAFVIMLVEPDINRYGDALWYCYAVFSTVGFGDILSVTLIGRILSVILSFSAILVIAVVTGVVVAFYNDLVAMQYKASKAEMLDKLERLDELSKEELKELSDQIKMIM